MMRDQSREQISAISGKEGGACDLHGRHWTGAPIAEREVDGEKAVLQYVHPDYIQVTESHLCDFAAEKTCAVCGDPTEEMPLWVAERILKACPGLVLEKGYRWEGVCQSCARESGCSHCAGEPDADDWDDHLLH